MNFYDAKAQEAALRNIQNHINAVGAENLDLKVVMHGDGVSMVIDPEYPAEDSKMKEANANADMQARSPASSSRASTSRSAPTR